MAAPPTIGCRAHKEPHVAAHVEQRAATAGRRLDSIEHLAVQARLDPGFGQIQRTLLRRFLGVEQLALACAGFRVHQSLGSFHRADADHSARSASDDGPWAQSRSVKEDVIFLATKRALNEKWSGTCQRHRLTEVTK